MGSVGVSPAKKGPKTKICREFLALVALHVNMEQVGPRGEMDSQQIRATMLAAMIGTEHEKAFNTKYAWTTCQQEHADILMPTGVRKAEDIRWMWVTWENLNQWFDDVKVRTEFLLIVHLFL